MTLQDQDNLVYVLGHKGPHPQEYHEAVRDRLEYALRDKAFGSAAYQDALRSELAAMRFDIQTSGTYLNKLVTKP
jgi:filamentous hemagglutinin